MAWRQNATFGTVKATDVSAKTLKIGGDPLNGTASTEVTASATELNYLDITAAGTAQASKAVVLDSSKGIVSLGRVTAGAFASATAGTGLALNATYTAGMRVYSDDGGAAAWAAGSVPDQRTVLGRNLFTYAQTGGHLRSAGVMGHQKAYNVAWNTEQVAGVYGYLELVRAAETVTFGGYGKSAGVIGCVETSGTMTINTNHIVAGVAAISKLSATGLTQTGKAVGVLVDIYDATNWSDGSDARSKWGWGVYIPARAAAAGVCVGDFASSYATGSGIPFSASVTTANRFYAESTADLTNAYNCRVILGRHLVVTSSATVNHETYGVTGQLCVKNTTLAHLHAGVTGTVEVSTAATFNSAYAYGVAGVMARVGTGTSITTATKPVCGFAAVYNAEALLSGSSIAVAACATGTANWTYFLGADHCDYFFYAATGTAYESGVKIGSMSALGGATHTCSGLLKVKVASTDYYIPLYGAGEVTGE